MDDIEQQHRQNYVNERERRWSMAKEGEEPAIKYICSALSQVLGVDESKVIYTRYDEIWFGKYNLKEYEWVKGCPDYSVEFALSDKQYCYVEIKLKAIEFLKTMHGGYTQNGSRVRNYGCTSYYLDIDPVYTNIKAFAEKLGHSKASIWLGFVKTDLSEVRLITLHSLQEIIEHGWRGAPLCQFAEGYGLPTYLIPKDATVDISSLNQSMISSSTMDNFILPS